MIVKPIPGCSGYYAADNGTILRAMAAQWGSLA